MRRFVRNWNTYDDHNFLQQKGMSDQSYVLKQADMPDESWGGYTTATSHCSNLYYFSQERKRGKVYSSSISASVGAEAKCVTVLFDGEDGS